MQHLQIYGKITLLMLLLVTSCNRNESQVLEYDKYIEYSKELYSSSYHQYYIIVSKMKESFNYQNLTLSCDRHTYSGLDSTNQLTKIYTSPNSKRIISWIESDFIEVLKENDMNLLSNISSKKEVYIFSCIIDSNNIIEYLFIYDKHENICYEILSTGF